MCPDTTLDPALQSTLLVLEIEQKVKGRVKVVKCGDITLRGGGRVVNSFTSSDTYIHATDSLLDIPHTPHTPHTPNTHDTHTTHTIDTVYTTRTPQQKLVDEAYEELHNSAPEVFVLSVAAARGLLNTDSLKNRYVLCMYILFVLFLLFCTLTWGRVNVYTIHQSCYCVVVYGCQRSANLILLVHIHSFYTA